MKDKSPSKYFSYSPYIIILYCLVTFQISFAQKTISGKIVDEKNKAIPFVHLRIENTNIGIISNKSGLFKLKYNQNVRNKIIVSSIGYKTKKVSLKEGFTVLVLKKDITQLNEVIVTQRDYAKELIVNAIKAIPNNYPIVEERHTGFTRETTRWKGRKKPIYIAELVTEAIKKPYNKQHKRGDVKLIEFRKYESSQLDSLSTRIYAGGHHIHRFDLVASRDAFLKSPNNFKYKILDTLQQQGKDIYKIYFKKKDKVYGNVYVMDSSYAIIKVDFNYHSFFEISAYKRQFLNYSVSYEQGLDKKWRFKHMHYETSFKKKEKTLNLVSDYVTTEVKPNKTKILYSESLQYSDVVLNELKEYKSEFWENYNILSPDNESEKLFKSIDYSKSDKQKNTKNLRNILKRFKLDYSLKWTPIKRSAYALTYNNSALDLNENSGSTKKTAWGFTNSILYEIKPNLYIGYNGEISILKTGINSHDVVLSKMININPSGRPIYISPSVNMGYQAINFYMGNYSSTEDFTAKGKTFDSGKTAVFLSERNIHVLPKIELSIEKSHRINFLLSVGYNFQLNKKVGLLFQEKDEFFLFRKKAFLENGNENLQINHKGNLLQNNISISVGVAFQL